MVQLANFNWVSIPGPFLALWGPIRDSQTVTLRANQALLGPPLVPKSAFWPLKRLSDGPKYTYLVPNVRQCHMWSSRLDIGNFETFQGPKRTSFAYGMDLLGVPKRALMSQKWASNASLTIM